MNIISTHVGWGHINLMALMVLRLLSVSAAAGPFRAGAHAEGIDPTNFPVLVNAMFTERSADRTIDPLHARALVLDDGTTRLALCVVDTCMMPRDLIDEAKELARAATGIALDRMLISSTHTHSVPSAMGCLGSRMDTNYARYLPGRIAAAITKAAQNLVPARIGWAKVDDWEHTYNRRWIRRPDRLLEDPFGQRNVRAHMHPGHESPDAIGPSGPVDPALTLLSVMTPDGRPLAVLANYSMHYYESALLSSDYFGRFATKLGQRLGATNGMQRSPPLSSPREEGVPFVGMMSQGTSGDLMWMDYGRPRRQIGYDAYAEAMADHAFAAWKTIKHRDHARLVMREAKLTLPFRVPDESRLAWATNKVASLAGRLPQSLPEIYANEAIYLQERPQAELKLQAICIGDFGITAIPNEVFAITGLKLKAQSPLQPLMNIELANGAEGYIPPPEQHRLGGYTTWPARTAGLATDAEPRITETLLTLLQEVSGRPRHRVVVSHGSYARAMLASKPVAYWRLEEFEGNLARNAVKGGPSARYEDGIAFHLRGVESVSSATNSRPQQPNAFSGDSINRAPHLAGGRIRSEGPGLGDHYSVSLWFWNGLPSDVRPVTGYLFSRGVDGAEGAPGDHVGIGGTAGHPGRLIFFNGNQRHTLLAGNTVVGLKCWNHLVLVRDGPRVEVWLNSRLEIAGAPEPGHEPGVQQLFFGGRNDHFANFEGKLDEIAVFDRALPAAAIQAQLREVQEALPASPGQATQVRHGPLKPDQALQAFETEPGLRVDLFASEPLTASPCAIAFDEQGRAFVAENRGYPTGGPGGKPVGVIALLEDTNGDGRPDKRTEFASGLTFPNGMMPWRGGLIVTCAPDVFYFKDTDHDGRADVKEVLLTGFATDQSTQLRVNKPMLAPDGWVYLASGLSGGKITSPKRPGEPPLDLKGDLRFKPDTGEYAHTDGKSQFGQAFDDYGRRFGLFNRVQVQHFVLPSHYVERNPHLSSPGVMQNCPELLENPFMRGGGGAARIYPISDNITTADSHAGTFSAACAIHLWRGGLLPSNYDGHSFSCDPTGNLVHHDRLIPSGATFAAERLGTNIEFLRSRDNWFRPVYLATGPDGALYVCDMYRKVIEHPEYLPAEVRKRSDFESGKGFGRLWRIAADLRSKNAARPGPSLASASLRTLVAELASPNAWRRDTAFRLLVERNDRATVPHLQAGLGEPTPAPAQAARLNLLSIFQALDEPTLSRALEARAPGVREVGLKLAEPLLPGSPRLQEAVVKIAADPEARVRFQGALALGAFLNQPDASLGALPALARIATNDAVDKWTRAAVISSLAGRERAFLALLLAAPGAGKSTGAPAVFADLGRVIARALPALQQTTLLAETLTGADPGFDALSAWLTGFSEVSPAPLQALAGSPAPAAARLAELFGHAKKVISDPSMPLTRRVRAALLLASANDPALNPPLLELLQAGEPAELQAAAIRVLTQPSNASGARDLLISNRWNGYTPALRGSVLSALAGRPEHHAALLDAIETGVVPAGALDSGRREQLKKSKNETIRRRALARFTNTGAGDRLQAFTAAKACLGLKPTPAHGREVFKKLCISCHRLDREGIAVGPDLFDIRNQPKESILLHLVIPEQEIAPNFTSYWCETRDGRTLTGLIANETRGSVTLRQAQGIEETIPRSNIVALTSSPLSLMPQDLEKGLSLQELADLLGYLKGEAE